MQGNKLMAINITARVKNFRVASDLHLEFRRFDPSLNRAFSEAVLLEILPPDPRDGESILILAGDIGRASMIGDMYEMLKDRFPYIIYVPGNHEYWGWEKIALDKLFQRLSQNVCPTLLIPTAPDNLYVLLQTPEGRCKILACTLWADGGKHNPLAEISVTGFPDFRQISYEDRKLRPADMSALNDYDSQWLRQNVVPEMSGYETPVVVVTHYIPSYLLINDAYKGDLGNCIFASDQDATMLMADTWIFGHTHMQLNKVENGRTIIANPLGYPREPSGKNYNPLLFVPLPLLTNAYTSVLPKS